MGGMAFQYQPRSVIGVPIPPASRERMNAERYLVVHYQDAKVPHPTTFTGEIEQARGVLRWGQTRPTGGKTDYEYNWQIGWLGTCFEHGGEFISAHTLGLNGGAVGVLFNTGVDGPSPAQVETFRELRAFLVQRGDLHPDHEVVPHYRFRDTACPGIGLAGIPGARWPSPTGQGRLGDVIPALLEPPASATPAPPSEDDPMILIQPTNDDGTVDPATFVVTGPYASWCKDGYEVAVHQAAGAHMGPDGSPWRVKRTELRRMILVGPAPDYGRATGANDTTPANFLRWVS
jgi:N-acetylmuramoyl-L-alanine amidase